MELNDLLRDLRNGQFFGSLELKFEYGRVVLIRKTETLKPHGDDCRDNRGTDDERKP
jgi:hypothetical protein